MNRIVRRAMGGCLSSLALCFTGPALAKVVDLSDRGFLVRQEAQVPVSPEEAWLVLLKPAQWWNSEHTWSGDAANLSIDARAGGCFCEILPDPSSAKARPRGGVEHMRVVYVERPRALRMTGLLGPLQAGAGAGTMTIQLKPADDGKHTDIELEYAVGGYLRAANAKLAPAVDRVLGEQIGRLVDKLGGAFTAAFPPQDADSGPAMPAPAPSPDILPLPDQPPFVDGSQPIGR